MVRGLPGPGQPPVRPRLGSQAKASHEHPGVHEPSDGLQLILSQLASATLENFRPIRARLELYLADQRRRNLTHLEREAKVVLWQCLDRVRQTAAVSVAEAVQWLATSPPETCATLREGLVKAQSTFEALYSEFDDAPPELRATMKAQMGTMGTVTAAALKENDRRIQEQADAARRAESDRRIKEQSDRLESLLGELTLEVEPAEEEAKASVAAVQAVVQAHLPPEKALEAAREAEETLAVARKALESAMATVRKDVAMLEAEIKQAGPTSQLKPTRVGALTRFGWLLERLSAEDAAIQRLLGHGVTQMAARATQKIQEDKRMKGEAEFMLGLLEKARVQTNHAEAEVQKAEEVVELLKGESTLVETMNASLAAEEIIGASRSVLHTASADLQSHIDSLKRDISPSHAHSTSGRKRSDTQQQLALLVEKLVAGRRSLDDSERSLRAIKARTTRRLTAERRQVEQLAVFRRYDVDGDLRLNRQEVAAFARTEYDYQAPEAFLLAVTVRLSPGDRRGVSFDKFRRLRQRLSIKRSEQRARVRREEEAERAIREKEDAERRIREDAERRVTVQMLLDDAGDLLSDLEQKWPLAKEAARELLGNERLTAVELKEAALKTESALAPVLDVLGAAGSKLSRAEDLLVHNLGDFLKTQAEKMRGQWKHVKERADEMSEAGNAARTKAETKEQEEEKAAKRRKVCAKLEQRYEELDEGDDEEFDF